MGYIGFDTYIRANNASSWGTSSGGDTWTAASSNGTVTLSINSNTGLFNGVASGTSNIQLIGAKTITDCELLIKAEQNTVGGSSGFSLVARSDGSNSSSANHYRCSLTTQLSVSKSVSGTLTSLGTFALTVSNNVFYWVRFRVVGTALMARTWQDETSEPTTWQINVTDSSLTSANQYGIRGFCSASGITVTVAHFEALDTNNSTIIYSAGSSSPGGVFS